MPPAPCDTPPEATVTGLDGAGNGWLAIFEDDCGVVATEPVTSEDGLAVLTWLLLGVSKGFWTSKRPEFEQPAAEMASSVRARARGQDPARTTSHARIWLPTHTAQIVEFE